MLKVQSLRFLVIVSFDLGFRMKDPLSREVMRRALVPKFAKVYDLELNEQVFDCEFIRRTAHRKPIVAETSRRVSGQPHIVALLRDQVGDGIDLIDLQSVPVKLVMEPNGISSARFVFSRKEEYKTELDAQDVIKLCRAIVNAVDIHMFPEMCGALRSVIPASVLRDPVLAEHSTYPIVATNQFKCDDEIADVFGILWQFESFAQARDVLMVEAVGRNLAVYRGDLFYICQPATVCAFQGATFELPGASFEKEYFEQHFQAVETLRRLNFLLKRFDVELSDMLEVLVKLVGTRRSGSEGSRFRSYLGYLERLETEVLSETDGYKNTRIMAMQEYAVLFRSGYEAFGHDRLYESIREKIESTYQVVSGLIAELRNEIEFRQNLLVGGLQFGAFFFASIALTTQILHPLFQRVAVESGAIEWRVVEAVVGTWIVPALDFTVSLIISVGAMVGLARWSERRVRRGREEMTKDSTERDTVGSQSF